MTTGEMVDMMGESIKAIAKEFEKTYGVKPTRIELYNIYRLAMGDISHGGVFGE